MICLWFWCIMNINNYVFLEEMDWTIHNGKNKTQHESKSNAMQKKKSLQLLHRRPIQKSIGIFIFSEIEISKFRTFMYIFTDHRSYFHVSSLTNQWKNYPWSYWIDESIHLIKLSTANICEYIILVKAIIMTFSIIKIYL